MYSPDASAGFPTVGGAPALPVGFLGGICCVYCQSFFFENLVCLCIMKVRKKTIMKTISIFQTNSVAEAKELGMDSAGDGGEKASSSSSGGGGSGGVPGDESCSFGDSFGDPEWRSCGLKFRITSATRRDFLRSDPITIWFVRHQPSRSATVYHWFS